jgi:hypothetical protein
MQNKVQLLQPQGRRNSAQRTEFYKQYYHEMIRRGAEGLRNMNVDLTDDNAPWPLGADGLPISGFLVPPALVRPLFDAPSSGMLT